MSLASESYWNQVLNDVVIQVWVEANKHIGEGLWEQIGRKIDLNEGFEAMRSFIFDNLIEF